MRPTVCIHHEQDAVFYQLHAACQEAHQRPLITFVNHAAGRVDQVDPVDAARRDPKRAGAGASLYSDRDRRARLKDRSGRVPTEGRARHARPLHDCTAHQGSDQWILMARVAQTIGSMRSSLVRVRRHSCLAMKSAMGGLTA